MSGARTITVRRASAGDLATVRAILVEADEWAAQFGIPMWVDDELSAGRIGADIASGMMFLAEIEGVAIGTVRFQLSDAEFWPDVPPDESAYIHRLAVRRRWAGQGVSTALMSWAAARTRAVGRTRLRLDCDDGRTRLRAMYERFGFRYHSDRQVGPYYVARYEMEV